MNEDHDRLKRLEEQFERFKDASSTVAGFVFGASAFAGCLYGLHWPTWMAVIAALAAFVAGAWAYEKQAS